jgi:methylated-DNA-[protein]-cysteine S-methyltransferase
MNIATLDTDFGHLGIVEEEGVITQLLWDAKAQGERTPLLDDAITQLSAFFEGRRDEFDLPLKPKGTTFQQRVYQEMLAIPKGQVKTYGDIAKKLGVPAQPVGQACGANPIPIIIPCHRVVSSSGGIGGFSGEGGVETKIALLKFERAYSLLL